MASNGTNALGKGLDALFADGKPTEQDKVYELPLKEIQPNRYQPRRDFDESALADLSESIKNVGVLQPIVVRRLPFGGYELIAGERRLKAAKLAGLAKIPALVREANDAEIGAMALIENLQRENLNVLEEADAYRRLMAEFKFTQEILARRVGRSRSHIANLLRLLKLPQPVRDYLANGLLSMGQVKPLLAIENADLQAEAAEFIQEKDLSARECESLAKKLLADPNYLREKPADSRAAEASGQPSAERVFWREAEDKLKMFFGAPVKIHQGKKKSRIEIEFADEDDLSRLLDSLQEKHAADKAQKIDELRRVSLSQNFTV